MAKKRQRFNFNSLPVASSVNEQVNILYKKYCMFMHHPELAQSTPRLKADPNSKIKQMILEFKKKREEEKKQEAQKRADFFSKVKQ